jgi:signal transduction histidine kinase
VAASDPQQPPQAEDGASTLLDELAAACPDWLFATDREMRLIYASDRLTRLAGERALHGERLDKACGAVARSRGLRQLLTCMAEGRPVEQIELPARLAGGLRYWQINAKPVFDSTGDFIGYRGFGRDVTVHRQTARHLIRAKEEAERASSDKSHFLAMMSHELRTPLNAIIGFSEILAEEREGPLGNPSYRDYAGNIRDSSRHLAALIGDVIEFARVERAEITLFEQPVDPAELLGACVKMCRPEARCKNIAMAELVEIGGVELTGDLTRLKQVLVNLLSNAVKFTPPEGRVEALLSRRPNGNLEFRISDTGIGIERQHLKRIFQPFVQGDAGIARRFGGIGLGLAFARKLARLHGGDVTIVSKPGVGTTARFWLPRWRVKANSE